jgi:hypothetical protein
MLSLTDYYLLLGLGMHLAFLGLVDWLAYRHLVTHGYDISVLLLGLLNIAIFCGVYYLVWLPLRRRIRARRLLRAGRHHQ